LVFAGEGFDELTEGFHFDAAGAEEGIVEGVQGALSFGAFVGVVEEASVEAELGVIAEDDVGPFLAAGVMFLGGIGGVDDDEIVDFGEGAGDEFEDVSADAGGFFMAGAGGGGVAVAHVGVAEIVPGHFDAFEGVHLDELVFVSDADGHGEGVGEVALESGGGHFEVGVEHFDLVLGTVFVGKLGDFFEVERADAFVARLDVLEGVGVFAELEVGGAEAALGFFDIAGEVIDEGAVVSDLFFVADGAEEAVVGGDGAAEGGDGLIFAGGGEVEDDVFVVSVDAEDDVFKDALGVLGAEEVVDGRTGDEFAVAGVVGTEGAVIVGVAAAADASGDALDDAHLVPVIGDGFEGGGEGFDFELLEFFAGAEGEIGDVGRVDLPLGEAVAFDDEVLFGFCDPGGGGGEGRDGEGAEGGGAGF
jgi:hypothetical protein